MTMGYGAGAMPEKMSDVVMDNEEAADCLLRELLRTRVVARQLTRATSHGHH